MRTKAETDSAEAEKRIRDIRRVKEIQAQAHQLKELVAELMIENRLLKKSVLGDGESGT